MDQINTPNVKTTNIGCATQLFRNCGEGGDATVPGAQFMNGVMMELLNAICKSCQTPMAFDEADPESYNQLWKAIQVGGGLASVPEWSAGTTAGVVRDDCCLYYANPEGDPENSDPSAKTDDADWFGCFDSLGELLSHLTANKQVIRKCGAAKGLVDGPVVQCDQLSKDFIFDEVTGTYSIDTGNLCIETEPVPACAEVSALFLAYDPATGCSKFASAGKINRFVDAFGNENTNATRFPPDPTDPDTFYTKGDFEADYTANSYDPAKLAGSLLACNPVQFPCDGSYNFVITAEGIIDWDTRGTSAFLITIDGVPMMTRAGNTDWYGRFTSTEGSYKESKTYDVNAGSRDVCLYIIGNSRSENAAQVIGAAPNGQPRVTIYRAVESI